MSNVLVFTAEKCPECGSMKLVYDPERGEVACGDCGVVLEEVEFAPPPGRIPKIEPRSYLGPGSEYSNLQRIELSLMRDINRLVSRLMLPKSVERTAVAYARKLCRRLHEQQGEVKTRLTKNERVIVSVWNAIKASGIPMSMERYVNEVDQLFPRKDPVTGEPKPYAEDFVKLLSRASKLIDMPAKAPDPTGYLNRLAAKLDCTVDYAYLSTVIGYAARMIRENACITYGRKPVIVAAVALLAADDLLARKIGAKRIAEVAGVGPSSVTGLVAYFKRHAPALPPEGASLQLERLFMGGEVPC